jgi:cell division protein FtsA
MEEAMPDKPSVAVGIDCGSSRTRTLFLSLEDQYVRYLGHGESESKGWVKGRVSDPRAIAESVQRAVRFAEQSAGVGGEGAVAGLGGSGVDGGTSRGLYEFGRRRTITREDLVYAIERASRLRLEEDRLVLMVMPQDFTIDGRAGFLNPDGAQASRLEANVQVITASLQEHECIVASVHEAHLAVEETVFEPVAAAYASVLAEERERGIAVVDIGAHSTDLAIYSSDALMASRSIPIGGDHFTSDAAYCLKLSFEDAERLKEEYGCARVGVANDQNLIELPAMEGRPEREARRGELNEILEARTEELFGYVKAEIEEAGMDRHLLEGVILCGGAAMLPGMLDMAEATLRCPARNGLPTGILDFPDELTTPAWTTAAGLAMYSARLKSQVDGRFRPPGFLNMILK